MWYSGPWSIPDNAKLDHLNGVKAAIKVGISLLASGYDAVEMVDEVVKKMEDDPTFDAGKDSHFNSSGEVEMDAIIADQDLNIGLVSAIRHINNPISIAG